jgi:putative nucleotidyltransferase with HDIG domain
LAKEQLPVSQLYVGAYIELPLKWNEHPFLRGRFLIKDASQIGVIRQLGLDYVVLDTERSKSPPPATPAADSHDDLSPAAQEVYDAQIQSAWESKQALSAELQRRREDIRNTEKQFKQTVAKVKDINHKMNQHPAQAIHEADELVGTIVQTLMHDQDNLVHLMSAHNLDDSLYYHQINVAVLALLLGRQLELSEADMQLLGMAALLHDIGKIKIPAQILRKKTALTKPEENLWRLHPVYSKDYLQRFCSEHPRVAQIAEQHHELADGSGFPRQLRGEQLDPLSPLVIMANYYDNLCNRPDPAQSMTPHEALSLMFAKQAAKFDKAALQRFVKLLGIYPPGTLVELSDGSLGIVISLNRAELLRPSILIYDANVPKEDAVIVDLNDDAKELSIKRSIRPSKLPEPVFQYLSPRERISYFFSLQQHNPNRP